MSELNVSTTIPERRDLGIEAWLALFPGISSVELVEFPMSVIDVKKSHANQARLGESVIPDRVAQYRRDLDNGAIFPPILCTSKGVVADGNQRVAAHAAAGAERIAAYVLDVNDTQFQLLALSANTKNGLPNSPEAQAAHVVQFHNGGTFTYRQIASMLGMTDALVSDIIHANSARDRLNRPRAVQKIPRGSLAILDQVQSDEQLSAAVDVVVSTGMNATDIRKLVNNVKKARTVDAAFAAIGAAGDSARKESVKRLTAKGASKPNDVNKFLRGAGLIQQVNPSSIALSANGSTDKLVDAIQGVVETVAALEKALSK